MRKARSCLSRGKRGGGAALSLLRRSHLREGVIGSAEALVTQLSFQGSSLGTVQELHRSKLLYGSDYPANMTITVTL